MNAVTTLLTACGATLVAAAANATMITATMTVDNEYTVYISTDPTTAGTAFGSNSSWPTLSTHSTMLTDGVTNYLHVFGTDSGGPEMFIGQFSLDDTDFAFANGTQSLLTNTSDWTGNNSGFGASPAALADLGPDGTSPWGFFGGIDDAARFIWTEAASDCGTNGNDCAYFATPIRWLGSTDPGGSVPAPATAALVVLGLGIAGVRRAR